MRKSDRGVMRKGVLVGLVLLAVGAWPAFGGPKSAPQAKPTEAEPEHLAVIADGDPSYGPAPLTVHFEVDTFDREDIKKFRWEFGDGATSNAREPTHTYRKPGNYTAWVTATSPSGMTDRSWVDITVEEPEPAAEQAPKGKITKPKPGAAKSK
jgi:PKD repeat protein